MPTAVSMVEKGCGATTVSAPVRALNSDDFPLLGKPTRPRRSTTSGYRPPSVAAGPMSQPRMTIALRLDPRWGHAGMVVALAAPPGAQTYLACPRLYF